MDMQHALAVYAHEGRLIDPDPEAPIILVNGREVLVSPAVLISGAQIIERNGLRGATIPYSDVVHASSPEEVAESVADFHGTTTSVKEEEKLIKEDNMFHYCPTHKKSLFSTPTGECKACQRTLQSVFDELGGLPAIRASISIIREHKRKGGAGNDVNGRLTREILNRIYDDPNLVKEYEEFLAPYDITLTHDPNGIIYHDYTALKKAPTPQRGPIPRGDLPMGWQEASTLRRELREAVIQDIRATRKVVMYWQSADGRQKGSAVLGDNTDETRQLAAQYQAAAKKKGFKARFQLES